MFIEAEKRKSIRYLTLNLRCHCNDWFVRQWSLRWGRSPRQSLPFKDR